MLRRDNSILLSIQWVSFWIKPEVAPARVTLGVTSLLTLSTQHAKSQAALPPVSYLKAVDAFMSTCTMWVVIHITFWVCSKFGALFIYRVSSSINFSTLARFALAWCMNKILSCWNFSYRSFVPSVTPFVLLKSKIRLYGVNGVLLGEHHTRRFRRPKTC